MKTQSLDVIADQIVFVNLDITNWSGKKTLTPEDLGLQRSQLPPETLVSLGDKQLIDPAALREFSTIRSAARRHCLAVGTRFMGGYIVPVSKAKELMAQLDGLKQQYEAKRTAFLDRFDTLVSNWTSQQPPEWQRLIREALVPSTYVGERLSFAAQAVSLCTPDPEVTVQHGLHDAIGGLSGQLFHEIALVAREALEKSFEGRTEVTRRALSPFKAMREKLDGLSFIDSRIGPIVQVLDRLLAGIPAKQAITGAALHSLVGFLEKAAQPERLRAYAEALAAQTVTAPAHSGLDFTALGIPETTESTTASDPVSVLLDSGKTLSGASKAPASSLGDAQLEKGNAAPSADDALVEWTTASTEDEIATLEAEPVASNDAAVLNLSGQAVIVPASRVDIDADDDDELADAVSAEAHNEGESWFLGD